MPNDLTHYGVPGMKWGVRKDRYKSLSGTEKKAQTNKFANNLNKQIDSARSRVYDSKVKYKQTKIEYKSAKRLKTGQSAAQRALTKAKNTYTSDKKIARATKFGRETVNTFVLSGNLGLALASSSRKTAAKELDRRGLLKQG